MSALGDYIHLHTENYLKYGVAKKGNPPQHFKAPHNYLQNRMKGVSSVRKETINILKAKLESNTADKITQDKKKMSLDMQDKINKLYEMIAQHTETSLMGYFYGTSAKAGWAYTGDYYTLKELTLSEAEITRQKSIYQTLNNKITLANKKKMISEEELNQIIQLYESIGGSVKGIKTTSILGYIQEAIQNTSFNVWRSHIVGEFGEKLVALCADKVQNLAADEIEDFLKESVVGNQRTAIKLDKKKVAKDLSSYISTDKEGNSYFLGSTQDKVDVKIQVNGQDVLASVKNYYDASRVELQKEVNLFSTLAFLESKQRFGTHWLNMHAGSLKGSSKDVADEILKQEIGYEALVSGNPLKQGVDQANIFIYLDRKTGKVFVKSTKDILIKEFSRINITPDITGILFNNKKDIQIQDRITKVLFDAHATQLHVTMSVTS